MNKEFDLLWNSGAIKQLAENFQCKICFELVEKAIECDLCGQFFCEKHVPELTNCAFCRSPLQFRESRALRRLVNELPIDCIYCKKVFTIGDIEVHHNHCLERPPVCGDNKCKYQTLNKEDALHHLIEAHGETIWANYNKLTAAGWAT